MPQLDGAEIGEIAAKTQVPPAEALRIVSAAERRRVARVHDGERGPSAGAPSVVESEAVLDELEAAGTPSEARAVKAVLAAAFAGGILVRGQMDRTGGPPAEEPPEVSPSQYVGVCDNLSIIVITEREEQVDYTRGVLILPDGMEIGTARAAVQKTIARVKNADPEAWSYDEVIASMLDQGFRMPKHHGQVLAEV